MLKNREVILAKIESTYNTDSVPIGSDAVLVSNLTWANEGLRMNDRAAVRANLGKLKQIYGGRLLKVSFDVEIKGSGTAGTAPEFGPLLRACGIGETVAPATSVTYAPASSNHGSCTIYLYRDGKRIILTGCRGNVSGNLDTGAQGKLSFSLTGHVAAETDTAMVTPSYDSTVPVPVLSAGFSVGGYSAVISKLAFDLGNTIATPPSINATDGYAAVQITARDVTGSFDPEDALVATKDWLADLIAGTSRALTTGVIGSTAGNRYQLSMPAIALRDVSPGDRDGVTTYDVTFGAAESSGDDEFSLVFT